MTERIDDDIKSRQAELDNLLKQKEEREINREEELGRLNKLETDVSGEYEKIESVYQAFLKAVG